MAVTAAAATLLLGFTLAYAQQEREQGAGNQGQDQQGQDQQGQDATEREAGERQAGQREGRAGRSQQGQQGREGQQGQQSGQLDQALATWLIIGNQGEVQISQLGQERSENQRVKEFSEKAIQDHTQFIQKLQQAADGQAGQGAQGAQGGADASQRSSDAQSARKRSGAAAGQDAQSSEAQAGQDRNRQEQGGQRAGQSRTEAAQSEQDRSAQFRAGAGGAHGQHGQLGQLLQIKQELGDKHVESCREELSQKQGAEFDKAYMTKQVALHQEMLDTLEVFSSHASQDLQKVLEQGQQTTQQHLEMAKQILQTVEQEQTR